MRAPTHDKSLSEGIRCDSNGCVARLPDGRAVAMALTAEGMIEDCEIAAFVVTGRNAPPGCAATIDRPQCGAGRSVRRRLDQHRAS